MSSQRFWRAGTALSGFLLFAPLSALAAADDPAKPQATPVAPKTATAATATTTVIVKGQKTLNGIDRQVYDNTKDPDSKTGSAVDVLNKVPGVSVDPTGAVTVRGKEPQILVNGKPAAYLAGDNRAAALQAMPSGIISSVEVMNNPGAQFGAGSGGPIINLITNAAVPPGGFGTVSAQVQSTGNKSAFVFGQYHAGKISVTGVISLNNNQSRSITGSVRRSLDNNGQTLRSTENNGVSENDSNSVFTNLGLDYALTQKDTLSGQISYMRSASQSNRTANNVIYGNTGTATDIYASDGLGNFNFENQTAAATWSHNGNKAGETLKVDWRVSRKLIKSLNSSLSLYSLATIPSNLAGYQTLFDFSTNTSNSTFSVDYNLPIGNDQLTTGIQITRDDSLSRNQAFGPGSASATTLPPSLFGNNRFDYSQTVSAAYVTYQKPFGDHWTVLGGVRAETFELNANAVTSNLTNRVKYTTYNPSLFATYVFSQEAKLRFSYSHRLLRPNATDYNPATVQSSETSVDVGKSNLKPQKTDSLEAGYEYSKGKTSYQIRGYYSRETDMVIYVSSFIPDPLNLGNLVLRTGRQNAGTRNTTGAEVNFRGKLTPKLTLSLNANLSTVAFDSPNFHGIRSVSGISGNNRLTFEATPKDSFILSYNIAPRLLDSQGYRTGYATLGLQYFRKLPQKMNLTVGLNDMLRSAKTANYTITPTVSGFSVRSSQAPVFFVSLSRSFGGSPIPSKSGGPVVITIVH